VLALAVLGVASMLVVLPSLEHRDMRDVVAQRYHNDCAPAAAAMLLTSTGTSVSYEEVRGRIRLGEDGASVRDLTALLISFGLPVASWHLDPSATNFLLPPAILFVNDAHFIVLDSIRDGLFFTRDPLRGHLALTGKEFAQMWDGIVIQRRQVPTPP